MSAARSLVKRANRVSFSSSSLRKLRYCMRDAAAKSLPMERVSQCGKYTIDNHVALRNSESGAYFSGVVTCGSVWHCPVCAAKIVEGRRQELKALIVAHLKAGGLVYMAAFTMPHYAAQTARELRLIVSKSWTSLLSGSPWMHQKTRIGLVGIVRAMEVTHGGNGWHPHIHALFFLPGSVSEIKAQEFGWFLFNRWRRTIRRRGYGDCNPSLWRFDLTRETQKAGDYVIKWGADRELTQGHLKLAKGGGLTPWQLILAMMDGQDWARITFREYAKAFKGARQLTFTRGIRELYGLREKPEDAWVVDLEEHAPVIGVFPRHIYQKVWRLGLVPDLLDAVELEPYWPTVVTFLRDHGVDVYEPLVESLTVKGEKPCYSGPAGRAPGFEGWTGESGGPLNVKCIHAECTVGFSLVALPFDIN